MNNLLRSEWHKISRHSMLVLFTLGIYPVGQLVLLALQWFIYFVVPEAHETLSSQYFLKDALTPWVNLTALQGAFFRLLPLAFIATVFSSEYTSSTWKVILPGQRRWKILATKAVIAMVMIWLSLAAWSLLTVIGNGLPITLLGKSYFPDWSGPAVRDFFLKLWVENLLAGATLAFLVALSALAAVLTRATMPAVGAGVLFSLMESIAPMFLVLGNSLFGISGDKAGFLGLWQYLPSYSTLNVREWLINGQAYKLASFPGGENLPEMSLMASALIFAAWIVGCGVLALVTFQRQDITS